ncbi:hypothetical protein [Kaistella sp.]|uniref:hypothetical protein n=1 Tax=Kaistella sp. TaxID=2782235 RepID=UPI0035A17AC0
MKRTLLFLTVFFSIAVFGCKCNEPKIRSSFESADFVYSIEFKSPDKIINELKLEKKQV